MATAKRIRVLGLARLQAVLMALLGFIAGILYSFGGAIYDVATTGSVNWGTALALLSLVGMPVIFAAAGAVLGLVEAVIYNLFAKWIGGVEIDLVRS